MKRKRFIKLLMSKGIQRNEANRRTQNVKSAKSYTQLYNWYYPNQPSFRAQDYGVRDMVGKVDWQWIDSIGSLETAAKGIITGGLWWDNDRGRPRKKYTDEVGPEDRISRTFETSSPFNTYRLGARPAFISSGM